jgi:hypothetical protein
MVRRLRPYGIGVVLLLVRVPASADVITVNPAVITSGSIDTIEPAVAGSLISLSGRDFSLTGGFGGGGTTACTPCAAGDTIRVGLGLAGGPLGPGSGTVAGQRFQAFEFGGLVQLAGAPVTLPASSVGSPFDIRFNFSVVPGSVLIGSRDPTGDQVVFILSGLTGNGIATMTLTQEPLSPGLPTLFDTTRIRWDFTSEPAAPTPEPGTWMLLSTGLLACMGFLRRGAVRAIH